MLKPKDKQTLIEGLSKLKQFIKDLSPQELQRLQDSNVTHHTNLEDIDTLLNKIETNTIEFEMSNAVSGESTVASVSFNQHQMSFGMQGYGDYTSQDDCGQVLAVEIGDVMTSAFVWSDINQEDYTHAISLEGAKLDLRRDNLEPK